MATLIESSKNKRIINAYVYDIVVKVDDKITVLIAKIVFPCYIRIRFLQTMFERFFVS